MHTLRRREALEFVREHTELIDTDREGCNPFATSEWLLAFIEHVARDDWTFTVPETLVDAEAFMLLYRPGKSRRIYSLANYYASLFSPLLGIAGDRSVAIARLVRQITESRPTSSVLQIAPLDAADPDTSHLEKALRSAGWYVRRYFCFGNWYLPCRGRRYADYLASLPSQARNTIARKSKKFHSENDGRIEILTDDASVDRFVHAFEHVYAKSWKVQEPYPDFIRAWARACGRKGWLRMGIAYIGGLPIAAQFWFTINGCAYIFKLAYDEEHAKLSAGTLLTARMIEHSLESDHVARIDYLSGDDAYKRTWMTNRRERVGLIACNPMTLHGSLTTLWELGSEVRARMRSRASQSIDPEPAAA